METGELWEGGRKGGDRWRAVGSLRKEGLEKASLQPSEEKEGGREWKEGMKEGRQGGRRVGGKGEGGTEEGGEETSERVRGTESS